MKIAAVIILFNPNIKEVENNIQQFIQWVDKLIIWQNSPGLVTLSDDFSDKIIYMGSEMNEFISKPLNEVIGWCHENEFDWLLTMDQDSTWRNFEEFRAHIQLYKDTDVVIYAPNVNNIITSELCRVEVETVITSGALHSVERVRELGGFREDYKIYWVDGEFCYWARLNGYKIIVVKDAHLTQKFGKEERGPFGIFVANYSPIVYYYLFRNMIWMKREYRKGLTFKTIIYTSKLFICGIIFGENQKFKKLFMIKRAIIEGLFSHIETRRK
ncbi:hypothetical protein [Pedobacter antarcticus]|uniref:hypothetical protein n=1 Tax=Pedobacter antarcticus TaxID=34086 RepID=UPI00087FAED4|nr:hypothetical protein [Pedobacter antarcticus]SDL39882.1 rhamnosyltransferase [Pedobacter antarcticus]